jgi:hypothetical protein
MKQLALLFFGLLMGTITSGQTWYGVYPGDLPLVEIDYYDGGIAANISPINEPHLFSTNTNDTTNAWVYGTSSKPFFENELGWVTDSVNAYSDSLRSELVVMIPSNEDGWLYQTSWILFEHKFETDTLLDGGYMEYSCDSINWEVVSQTWGTSGPPQQLEVLRFTSVLHDTVQAFTGSEPEWQWSAVQFIWYYSVFHDNPSRSGGCTWENVDTLYVRFVFESDGIQTSKAGWMIRNITIGLDNFPGAVDEYLLSAMELYPNPTNGVISFNFLENVTKPETVEVYDMMGKKVLSMPYQSTIDVSVLNAGNYIVTVFTKKGVFRQKLVVE